MSKVEQITVERVCQLAPFESVRIQIVLSPEEGEETQDLMRRAREEIWHGFHDSMKGKI